MNTVAPGESLVIRIARALTIANALECREDLVPATTHQGPVYLCLDDVSVIDLTGVQLLLAARHSLESRSHQLLVGGVPAVIQEAFELLGLDQLQTADVPAEADGVTP